MSMTLVSINVGLPREVAYGEETVVTGIFKQAISGPVAVRRENLDGDGQADPVHHGGIDKAVYAYSLDHYPWWRQELGLDVLPHGQFGENLTIAGLDESTLCLGDQLQMGDARFVITQPRVPCFKLGLRFDDKRLPQLFTQSLRSGVYLRVLQEGTVQAGDTVEVVAAGHAQLPIRTLFDAYFRPNDPAAQKVLQQALDVPELSAEWRHHIGERLARRGHPAS